MARADSILVGYTFDSRSARYRSSASGKFVARSNILSLLDAQISTAEQRMGELTTALVEQRLSPIAYQSIMRDEMRRLHLQNAALGAGGIDKLGAAEFGRSGALLREDYKRMTNLANGIARGEVSLPQALNRIQGYAGSARINFLAAERDANRQAAQLRGAQLEERRRLGVAEHCRSCVDYAALGWVPLGELPLPGQGSICGTHCRCSLERREVVEEAMRA
jgi:hypothetical protein